MVLSSGFILEPAERGDDHKVSSLPQPRRRPIQENLSRTTWRWYCVRLKPLPIVDVPNVYSLIREDACCIHQTLIHPETTLVVQVNLGHRRTVNLRSQHFSQHDLSVA